MKLVDFAPKSLLARFLLIIIIPVVLTELIATYIFYERHWDSVSGYMEKAVVGEIVLLHNLLQHQELNHEDSAKLVSYYQNYLFMNFSLDQDSEFTPREVKYETLDGRSLSKALRRVFSAQLNFREEDKIYIEIGGLEGVTKISLLPKRISNPTTYIFILWMLGSAFILLSISLILMRNQLRSVKELADAADKFGRGINYDFKPSGALEVRKAGLAFIEMRNKVERQIRLRTEMLAGVSHDLKTPLTRMKLILSMMKEHKDLELLKNETKNMEELINDYLQFTKDDQKEESKTFSLSQLVEQLIEQFKHASTKEFILKIEPNLFFTGRKISLKRAVANLISNADKYGKSKVRITLRQTDTYIKLIIEDDGKGISKKYYSDVFRPFFRLEASRNSKTGGTGLGLSICKDIIIKHDGKILLGSSKTLGGLKVQVLFYFPFN